MRRSAAYLRSLDRGLAVLDAFGPADRLSLEQVARRAGLSAPDAWELMLTLAELGLLAVEGPLFRLCSPATVLRPGGTGGAPRTVRAGHRPEGRREERAAE